MHSPALGRSASLLESPLSPLSQVLLTHVILRGLGSRPDVRLLSCSFDASRFAPCTLSGPLFIFFVGTAYFRFALHYYSQTLHISRDCWDVDVTSLKIQSISRPFVSPRVVLASPALLLEKDWRFGKKFILPSRALQKQTFRTFPSGNRKYTV